MSFMNIFQNHFRYINGFSNHSRSEQVEKQEEEQKNNFTFGSAYVAKAMGDMSGTEINNFWGNIMSEVTNFFQSMFGGWSKTSFSDEGINVEINTPNVGEDEKPEPETEPETEPENDTPTLGSQTGQTTGIQYNNGGQSWNPLANWGWNNTNQSQGETGTGATSGGQTGATQGGAQQANNTEGVHTIKSSAIGSIDYGTYGYDTPPQFPDLGIYYDVQVPEYYTDSEGKMHEVKRGIGNTYYYVKDKSDELKTIKQVIVPMYYDIKNGKFVEEDVELELDDGIFSYSKAKDVLAEYASWSGVISPGLPPSKTGCSLDFYMLAQGYEYTNKEHTYAQSLGYDGDEPYWNLYTAVQDENKVIIDTGIVIEELSYAEEGEVGDAKYADEIENVGECYITDTKNEGDRIKITRKYEYPTVDENGKTVSYKHHAEDSYLDSKTQSYNEFDFKDVIGDDKNTFVIEDYSIPSTYTDKSGTSHNLIQGPGNTFYYETSNCHYNLLYWDMEKSEYVCVAEDVLIRSSYNLATDIKTYFSSDSDNPNERAFSYLALGYKYTNQPGVLCGNRKSTADGVAHYTLIDVNNAENEKIIKETELLFVKGINLSKINTDATGGTQTLPEQWQEDDYTPEDVKSNDEFEEEYVEKLKNKLINRYTDIDSLVHNRDLPSETMLAHDFVNDVVSVDDIAVKSIRALIQKVANLKYSRDWSDEAIEEELQKSIVYRFADLTTTDTEDQIREKLEIWLERADKDSDGQVSLEEYFNYLSTECIDPKHISRTHGGHLENDWDYRDIASNYALYENEAAVYENITDIENFNFGLIGEFTNEAWGYIDADLIYQYMVDNANNPNAPGLQELCKLFGISIDSITGAKDKIYQFFDAEYKNDTLCNNAWGFSPSYFLRLLYEKGLLTQKTYSKEYLYEQGFTEQDIRTKFLYNEEDGTYKMKPGMKYKYNNGDEDKYYTALCFLSTVKYSEEEYRAYENDCKNKAKESNALTLQRYEDNIDSGVYADITSDVDKQNLMDAIRKAIESVDFLSFYYSKEYSDIQDRNPSKTLKAYRQAVNDAIEKAVQETIENIKNSHLKEEEPEEPETPIEPEEPETPTVLEEPETPIEPEEPETPTEPEEPETPTVLEDPETPTDDDTETGTIGGRKRYNEDIVGKQFIGDRPDAGEDHTDQTGQPDQTTPEKPEAPKEETPTEGSEEEPISGLINGERFPQKPLVKPDVEKTLNINDGNGIDYIGNKLDELFNG